jgi:nitrate/nitrite transporter NarK
MWGNFGASAAAKLLPWVLAHHDANKDWHEVFLVCAGSYLVAILAALGMNSLERVEQTADQGG